MGSLRDADIIKEADLSSILRGAKSGLKGAWSSLPVRSVRGPAGKGLNVLFGTMFGATALGHLGELADKGPVGVESQARWEAELARRHAANTPGRKLRAAKSNVRKGSLLGALAGAAVAAPFAYKKKNLLLPLVGALVGRTVGKTVAQQKHPGSVPTPSGLDDTIGRYAGLFTPEQRQNWITLRNSSSVRNSPELQGQLNQMILGKVKVHPEFIKHQKKQKSFSTLGKVLGGGAVLAAMLFAKKKGTGLLAKPGGLMSGSPFKAFAGMGLAGTGLGVLGAHAGARRAKLTPAETRSAVANKLLSADTALSLGFYAPAFRGARGLVGR